MGPVNVIAGVVNLNEFWFNNSVRVEEAQFISLCWNEWLLITIEVQVVESWKQVIL